ncbi:unnamed protein product [Dovyalis caffra]|uniref:Uncharacterized protein n=1 Tax=Dovyalis caffra TaxID=77055 RepID=A0AAV1S7M7_9ROSI|nr:unnamed protein product [Dovyalis caffra]
MSGQRPNGINSNKHKSPSPDLKQKLRILPEGNAGGPEEQPYVEWACSRKLLLRRRLMEQQAKQTTLCWAPE